jgi:hypothetical protein
MCRDLYAPLIYSPSGLHPGNPGASDFHADVLPSIPTGSEGGSFPSFLTSCQHLSPLVLVIAILTKARWNHKAILSYISLIAKDIESFFKCFFFSLFFTFSSPSSSLHSPENFKTGSCYTSTDRSRTNYGAPAGLTLMTLGFMFTPFTCLFP